MSLLKLGSMIVGGGIFIGALGVAAPVAHRMTDGGQADLRVEKLLERVGIDLHDLETEVELQELAVNANDALGARTGALLDDASALLGSVHVLIEKVSGLLGKELEDADELEEDAAGSAQARADRGNAEVCRRLQGLATSPELRKKLGANPDELARVDACANLSFYNRDPAGGL